MNAARKLWAFPVLLTLLGIPMYLAGQGGGITGQVVNAFSGEPLQGVLVTLAGLQRSGFTDEDGRFFLSLPGAMEPLTCDFSLEGFQTLRITALAVDRSLDLGVVHLRPEPGELPPESLITLGHADQFEEDLAGGSSDFLQAGRDVFLNHAAFDFSPAFFRVRGYDSRYASVYLNGIPMNRFFDGRPQWNNWGGLNDVSRNQHHLTGPVPGDHGFGSLQGTTRIEISPSALREGLRLTFSSSDRNYQGRMIATYNTGRREHGWGLLLSASRRIAGEAYMEGSPYDAFSALASVGFEPSDRHEFTLTGVLASNRRGRSAALSAEVLELMGRSYNPYWGYQKGEVRNSRMRTIREPFLNFRYRYKGPRLRGSLAAAYQWGGQSGGRLGYFDAPSPEPTYYRYLPSFYWNRSFGPNLLSAASAGSKFIDSPQIDWEGLYDINRNLGRDKAAAYILLSDRMEENQLSANSWLSMRAGKHWELKAGVLMQRSDMAYFARLDDLLGASFHRDVDPFTDTRNDLEGSLAKTKGDRIGYNYRIGARRLESFITLQAQFGKWSAFLSGRHGGTAYQRTSLFRNERFGQADPAIGPEIKFPAPGLKAGGSYRFSGRHLLKFNSALFRNPPIIRNLYISARDRAEAVPGVRPEQIFSADLSYIFRGPVLSSRVSAYHTSIMDLTEVNYFFTESGYGSGFVSEVTTGIGVLHRGVEAGFQVAVHPSVEVTGALALGDHRYVRNPRVALFFMPGEDPGDIGEAQGSLDLGLAQLKGRYLPTGPSRAVSLGIRYRGPSYWWAGATASYLDQNYPDLALIRHTQSFLLDPATGEPATGIREEDLRAARRQEPLPPAYLLNLTAGRSWRWNTHYLSVFLSLSNVFDQFFLSGGYQLSRNGNYRQWQQDHLGGRPSFGSRYWPGSGRTYFINLSWSFR